MTPDSHNIAGLHRRSRGRNFTIRVSDEEYDAILADAAHEGARSASAYARTVLLEGDNSLAFAVKKLNNRLRALEVRVNQIVGNSS